jgi:hypothetical protein
VWPTTIQSQVEYRSTSLHTEGLAEREDAGRRQAATRRSGMTSPTSASIMNVAHTGRA